MGRAVFGAGPMHTVLQFATAGILILAANTAYVDFPRLSSASSPATATSPASSPTGATGSSSPTASSSSPSLAGALLVAFRGLTNAAHPALRGRRVHLVHAQPGRHGPPPPAGCGSRRGGGAWSSTPSGAVATCIVLLIVAVTKFAVGAWLPIVVVPVIIVLFVSIKRHYARVRAHAGDLAGRGPAAADQPHRRRAGRPRPPRRRRRPSSTPGRCGPTTSPPSTSPTTTTTARRMEKQWKEFGFDVPLEIVDSPYRELVDAGDAATSTSSTSAGTTTPSPWSSPSSSSVGLFAPTQLLHNQSAAALKLALLFRKGTVVTSVPYHVE